MYYSEKYKSKKKLKKITVKGQPSSSKLAIKPHLLLIGLQSPAAALQLYRAKLRSF
jgi:hypothetical protein